MNIIKTDIHGLLILEPRVFQDDRGYFFESYNRRVFEEKTGLTPRFAQDNFSRSNKNVLRGLHYQIRQPQGKLVWVTSGKAFDVAVDLRKSSPTFGKWFGTELSSANKHMLWVPEGFAHGFLVLSDHADFLYKTTDFYAPSTSARSSGMTPISGSSGRSRRNPSSPQRTVPGRRSGKPKSSTDAVIR